MPSLKDLATLTSRLDQLAAELHSELTGGAIDFRKMVGLADEIGQDSDRLAAAFNTMADALEKSLDGAGAEGADGNGGSATASVGEQSSA
jgi:hypothetical protein